MRRFCQRVLPVIMTGILVGVAAACSSGDSETSNPTTVSPTASAQNQVIPDPGGLVSQGGGPPEYAEPVILVPGDYRPPSADLDARQKWTQAVDQEQAKPQANLSLGGFRIYGFADAQADSSVNRQECVSVDFKPVTRFQFTYLPPGTKAFGPQYEGVCADGSIAWVAQDLGYGYGRITVGYQLGENAVGTDATAERVSEISVNGHPGIAIKPLIDEGNGQSIIAFHLNKGFIVLGVIGLPLDETTKIAEGIVCVDC